MPIELPCYKTKKIPLRPGFRTQSESFRRTANDWLARSVWQVLRQHPYGLKTTTGSTS